MEDPLIGEVLSGTYRIEVWGAQGGVNHGGDVGGRGAQMRGDFELNAGEELGIIVGQLGLISPTGNTANGGSGGGGGTFVWRDGEAQPEIVAGGGSGLRNNGDPNYRGRDGVTGNDGTAARDNQGLGGVGGADAPNGGGHGWNGIRAAPDGIARDTQYGGDGGFGGGGGGGYGLAGNRLHSAGGGGGYSGGGICTSNFYAGGGGGSYNVGANQSNSSGVNGGHGQVSITKL